MVFDHLSEYDSQWSAIVSISSKMGCSAETLRRWVRRSEIDSGRRGGLTSDERARFKERERENRELRRVNEILRKASAFFAQAELDRRRSKPVMGGRPDICGDLGWLCIRGFHHRCFFAQDCRLAGITFVA